MWFGHCSVLQLQHFSVETFENMNWNKCMEHLTEYQIANYKIQYKYRKWAELVRMCYLTSCSCVEYTAFTSCIYCRRCRQQQQQQQLPCVCSLDSPWHWSSLRHDGGSLEAAETSLLRCCSCRWPRKSRAIGCSWSIHSGENPLGPCVQRCCCCRPRRPRDTAGSSSASSVTEDTCRHYKETISADGMKYTSMSLQGSLPTYQCTGLQHKAHKPLFPL